MREDGKRDSGGDLRLLRLSAPACLYNKILVNIKIHFVNSLTLCLDEFNRCFDVIVPRPSVPVAFDMFVYFLR